MKNKKSISFIELVTLFQNEGYTVKQLAKHFNLSETTIRRRLKECGITFKKTKECNIEDFETDDEHIPYYYYKQNLRITDEDIKKLKEGKTLFTGVGDEFCVSLVYVKK